MLGFLELSWHPLAAVGFLRPVTGRLHQARWRDPFGELKPDAIEALIAVGESDEAAELLADLEDWSRSVNASATRATAWRCRGLLRAARGDDDGASEALGQALRAFQRLLVPFERGAHAAGLGTGAMTANSGGRRRGRWVRRWPSPAARRAAVGRAGRVQLAQLGGWRPQDATLTPTETQTARLVAQGRTN